MNNFIILFLIFVLFSCQSNKDETKKEIVEDENTTKETEPNDVHEEEKDTFGLAQFKMELAGGFFDYEENGYIYFSDLRHDYGILIIDHEYDAIEETEYLLFYKNEKKIYRTSDLNKLKEKLAALPKGIILDWYDTCTFSKCMSFIGDKKKAFEDLCKNLQIDLVPPSWGDNPRNVICYCDKMR